MNIFALSPSASESAKAHCDIHLHKMILESAQMLSTAVHQIVPDKWQQLHSEQKCYKPTHVNHPCNIWIRESVYNAMWLCDLGIALALERGYRGFNSGHKSTDIIFQCREVLRHCMPHDIMQTPHVFCGPDYIAAQQWDTHTKYQALYRDKYANGMRMYWTKRSIPEFMTLRKVAA